MCIERCEITKVAVSDNKTPNSKFCATHYIMYILLANGNLYVAFAVKMSDFRVFPDFMLRFIDECQ